MLDKIFIENIKTAAIIGIHDAERVSPQPLVISVELGCDIRSAADNDEISNALDYAVISEFIDNYVRQTTFALIETLAERLVSDLFAHFSVQTIKLRLEKPAAIALTQQVGVEIFRQHPSI